MVNAPSKNHKLSYKIPSACHEKSSIEVLIKESKALHITVGCLPELDDKNLFR